MNRLSLLGTLVVVSWVSWSFPARATEWPSAFAKRITIELREANVRNVYRLVGQVTATEVVVDECLPASRKLDIKLKNAPVSVVLDIMALKLGVTHDVDADRKTLTVSCVDSARSPADEAALDKRVTLDVQDAALANVAALLAGAGGLKVHALSPLEGKVTLRLVNVRLATAVAAVRESLDLEVLDVKDGSLLVATRAPAP